MQKELKKGSKVLNDYHQQKSKEACLEVEEMLKQSYSLEQMQEQAIRIKSFMEEKRLIKDLF